MRQWLCPEGSSPRFLTLFGSVRFTNSRRLGNVRASQSASSRTPCSNLWKPNYLYNLNEVHDTVSCYQQLKGLQQIAKLVKKQSGGIRGEQWSVPTTFKTVPFLPLWFAPVQLKLIPNVLWFQLLRSLKCNIFFFIYFLHFFEFLILMWE